MPNCKFCKSTLSTNSALRYHQKHTKKCLKSQGKDITGEYKCEGCNKPFNTKIAVNNHRNICFDINTGKKNTGINNKLILALEEVKKLKLLVENKCNTIKLLEMDKKSIKKEYKGSLKILKNTIKKHEDTLNKKDREIAVIKNTLDIIVSEKDKYQSKLESNFNTILEKVTKSAMDPKTTNTTNKQTIIATFPFSEEDIKYIVESKLNADHVKQGLLGIASFAVNNVLKDEKGLQLVTVTDKSRNNVRYKTPDGLIVIDRGFTGMSSKIAPHIKRKANGICSENFEDALNQEHPLSIGISEINDDRDCIGFVKHAVRLLG